MTYSVCVSGSASRTGSSPAFWISCRFSGVRVAIRALLGIATSLTKVSPVVLGRQTGNLMAGWSEYPESRTEKCRGTGHAAELCVTLLGFTQACRELRLRILRRDGPDRADQE